MLERSFIYLRSVSARNTPNLGPAGPLGVGTNMNREIVNGVEWLASGELLLILESQGEPFYQFVYRGAAGVYWDADRHGFKSTPIRECACSAWFRRIVCVVRLELGIELHLGKEVAWRNIPDQDRVEIVLGKSRDSSRLTD